VSLAFYIIPFTKVRKALKDHHCMACGNGIPRGSSYYYSHVENNEMNYLLKYCIECFEKILSSPPTKPINIFLDR
jgi:hypothetical protein